MVTTRFLSHWLMLGMIPATMMIGAVRANRDLVSGGPVATPIANAAIAGAEGSAPAAQPVSAGQDVARGTDGLFYVTAKVNGRPLRFLVDTGASIVVLTAADAQAVGVRPEEHHYNGKVETVGGSTAMAWTTLDHVHVAGHDMRKLRAVVVRSGLGVSLMGQNMLAELDSVTFKADRLSLR